MTYYKNHHNAIDFPKRLAREAIDIANNATEQIYGKKESKNANKN